MKGQGAKPEGENMRIVAEIAKNKIIYTCVCAYMDVCVYTRVPTCTIYPAFKIKYSISHINEILNVFRILSNYKGDLPYALHDLEIEIDKKLLANNCFDFRLWGF